MRFRNIHRDQRGTISILSTFALLMFTMLLLLVTNVAQQVDDKVRMQTAADAATYSGGVVLARGMNAIAFANHLECDVFAVTAFLREARDRNVEQLVPEILAKWNEAGGKFTPAEFDKFRPLPSAIPNKTPLEQELVSAWGEMAHSAAEFALPVFEHILGTPEDVAYPTSDHLIPNFQRTVLLTVPTLSQEITNEIALRHGLPNADVLGVSQQMRDNPSAAANGRSAQFGVLWRTAVLPVGIADETDPMTRTLPVVDPDPAWSDFFAVPDGQGYLTRSQQRRRDRAFDYMDQWIDDDDLMKGLGFFGDEAKMSQFQALFRLACCAQLNQLLNVEYPGTNVPMLLRQDFGGALTDNAILERDYTFIGAAYRAHVNEMAPLMYSNPVDRQSDAVTFAQLGLYVPRRMYRCCPWATPWYDQQGDIHWQVHTNGWPNEWDMFTQNWMVRLVPATSDAIPSILQTNPGGYAASVRVPNLGGATMQELDAINTH
jgi:hypothetical protein